VKPTKRAKNNFTIISCKIALKFICYNWTMFNIPKRIKKNPWNCHQGKSSKIACQREIIIKEGHRNWL